MYKFKYPAMFVGPIIWPAVLHANFSCTFFQHRPQPFCITFSDLGFGLGHKFSGNKKKKSWLHNSRTLLFDQDEF